MTRNSRRTQVTESPASSPAPGTQQRVVPPEPSPRPEAPNPFGLSFVAPTQFVDLPSRGLLYDRTSPLRGTTSVEIKYMTAKEEDILVNEDYMSRGILFDKLIDSLLVDKRISSRDFLAGDKNAILIAARATGYGAEYKMRLPCPHCGKVGVFCYDLNKVSSNVPSPQELEEQGIEYDSHDNVFRFELPNSKIRVGITLLTGHDHEYLKKQEEQKEKLNLETNTTIDFLRKVIVEANDVTDPSQLNQLAEVLPAIDSRKIRTVYANMMPEADTKQPVTCEHCSEESESEVPFTLEFFWPDV